MIDLDITTDTLFFPAPWRVQSWETALEEIIHRVVDDDGNEICRCASGEIAHAVALARNFGDDGKSAAHANAKLAEATACFQQQMNDAREYFHEEVAGYAKSLREVRAKLVAAEDKLASLGHKVT